MCELRRLLEDGIVTVVKGPVLDTTVAVEVRVEVITGVVVIL
jgi:hypothetical protein